MKLGEGRRKQLKAAISDRTQESPLIRDKVREIGKIKEATLPELFAMADAAGILEFALGLVEDRAEFKKRNRVIRAHHNQS